MVPKVMGRGVGGGSLNWILIIPENKRFSSCFLVNSKIALSPASPAPRPY